MKSEELELLIKEGEGLTVEFKEKYTAKIVQDIVAFANSKGGKVILGVTDSGAVKGEKLTGQLKAEIFSLGRNCDPVIDLTIKQVQNLIVISVDEGSDKPYSCASIYYKRFDAVTQKLNRNEIKALFENNVDSQFDEKTSPKVTLNDISLKKVKAFYEAAGIAYKTTRASLPNILKSLNLMNKNLVNNAGVLFFAEKVDPFIKHSQIMLLAFKDYHGADIFDRKEVRGDLVEQFNEADFFLKKHLSLQAIIESTRRRNVYEIPQEACREALANAIIHRDYSLAGTSIQIRLFPDRLEVISPGGLPKGINIKNIGNLSARRNEVIADMFARLDIVEKAGTGIVRIKESLKREGLSSPLFEDMGGFFKITLFRPQSSNVRENVRENAPNLNVTQRLVLEAIKTNPNITTQTMSESINKAERTIHRAIDQLKKLNLIQRIGSDRGGSWKIIKAPSSIRKKKI